MNINEFIPIDTKWISFLFKKCFDDIHTVFYDFVRFVDFFPPSHLYLSSLLMKELVIWWCW